MYTPSRFSNKIKHFQSKILDRYGHNKRDLPRRDTFDSYQVLISETMLQQTQVDRVIPKYLTFLDTLPTLSHLAQAEKVLLLGLRSWLWFNSRALRLQQCAEEIIKNHEGHLPKERKILLTLPWIGPYTSASLLAFAYNIAVPVIDTNIRRVLIAELDLPEEISLQDMEKIALVCIPEGKSNDRHNALMDYGATVLTSKKTGIKPLSRQSRFEGSRRQIRGKVVKYLIKHGATSLDVLATIYPHIEFESIVQEMQRDDLVKKKGALLMIW